MSITLNTKVYDLDATVDVNKNQYVGPNHSISSKDLMSLSRSRSTSNSASVPGYARAFAKFTRTVTVGDLQMDAFAEMTITLPVGVAKSDADSIRDDLGDLLVSANGENLVWKQDINQ